MVDRYYVLIDYGCSNKGTETIYTHFTVKHVLHNTDDVDVHNAALLYL